MIYNNTFEDKLHKFKTYILYTTPIIIILQLFSFHDMYIRELDGISLFLSTISIPICFLYSKINRKDRLYIFGLFYISILVENIINVFFIHFRNSINGILFPLILRNFFLYIELSKNITLSNFIEKHIKISIVLTLFLTIIPFSLDKPFKQLLSTKHVFVVIFIVLIIISLTSLIYMILKLNYMAFKEKNFVKGVFGVNIFILFIKLFFLPTLINSVIYLRLPGKSFYFNTAFLVLSIGLLVEFEDNVSEIFQLYNNVEAISKDMENMKELDSLRSNFFANLSHEFKTPLTIIFSCLQLIDSNEAKGDWAISQSYLKYNKTIKQNCNRMLRLTGNLVDITKIQSEFLNLHFKNHEIVSLIENITSSVIPYVESNTINIIFDTTIEELLIKCDSDSIERIMLNLLSNSIKYSNKNGNILVCLDADSDFITIKVIDDGIGIKEDKIDKIFEPFVQCDKSLARAKEGSGIGLSLVKKLVEMHNGTISINSTYKKGTEIIIKLPNTICNNIEINNKQKYNTNNIISKIEIEFSDIYDL